ncbi:MAG: hypothetical protein ABJF10_22180 [Chthoniobacter sp.]|uniref:hypothetical protein n=1 Tax=Chthoniobacter sp. TaxID=2510640 RepID=UPI0032A22382
MKENSRSSRWIWYPFLLILAGAAFLTACSTTGAAAIYGKWRLVHSNQSEAVGTPETKENIVMEFRADGSVILIQDKKSHTYRFRYSGGDKLQLIIDSGALDKMVEFTGTARMRLIQDRAGVAWLTPIVDEYERIAP